MLAKNENIMYEKTCYYDYMQLGKTNFLIGVFMLLIMMILELILGIPVCIIGWVIWKKQKINFIHSYHYSKINEQNKPLYTKQIGKGTLLIGLALMFMGLINFATNSFYGWFAFGAGFVSGIILIIRAQIKYNRGIF